MSRAPFSIRLAMLIIVLAILAGAYWESWWPR